MERDPQEHEDYLDPQDNLDSLESLEHRVQRERKEAEEKVETKDLLVLVGRMVCLDHTAHRVSLAKMGPREAREIEEILVPRDRKV